MNDLFSTAGPSTDGASFEPLASRMRPRTLDEFIGQDHILGPGRLLRRAVAADMLGSIILAGPPGTGKTTLARVIANTTKSRFTSLNAVLGGVKDVRDAIETAQKQRDYYGHRTILFVDEVHRWNKAQQDALLPWVENGTVTLIGATTENPFFEVNSALVSRSRIFQLTPLTKDDLHRIARQALSDVERGYGAFDIQIDDSALSHLVDVSDGDARTLLNALQLAVETTPDRFPPDGPVHIGLSEAEDSIQRRALLYDREGDYHFDAISAFIKSVRGSDPDAALYWMARMIRAGEDPRYLFRRMLVLASEDIGLADPHALGIVESAAAAFDRVGMPEGQYHLTHAALYLSTAPKSNSTLGYFDAVKAIEEETRREIPKHLRDANRDAAGFGHGEGYRYPHAYRDHWVAQAYLPEDLAERVFYHPSKEGYEARVGAEVQRKRELQLAEMDDTAADSEVLTYTAPNAADNRWYTRSQAGTAARGAVREALFAVINVPRHARVFVFEPGPPVLVWEALRAAPEGLVVALYARAQDRRRALERLEGETAAGTSMPGKNHIQEHERADARHRAANPEAPILLSGPPGKLFAPDADAGQLRGHLGDGFEAVASDRLLARFGAEGLSVIVSQCARGARVAMCEPAPMAGMRLSDLARNHGVDEKTTEALADAERSIFPRTPQEEQEAISNIVRESGLTLNHSEMRSVPGKRTVGYEDIQSWLSADSAYGAYLESSAGAEFRDLVRDKLVKAVSDREVDWHRAFYLIDAVKRSRS
ncbi:MAG: AAA family ATPase [Spirochaetales bacterium]